MYPWLKVLYETLIFGETPTPSGWAGAIDFSAGSFRILYQEYNYYYGRFIPFYKTIDFARNILKNFFYPE
jgi:hypothetical protein